jgi:hypothetical protein
LGKPAEAQEVVAHSNSDDTVFITPRRAVIMEIQNNMLTMLSAMLEGPNNTATASRLIRHLDLPRIPELFGALLVEVTTCLPESL